MSDPIRPRKPPPRGSADRLVLAGGVLFLVGLIALGAAVLISVRHRGAPVLVEALAALIPIGLAVSFSGLVVQRGGSRRR